MTKNNRRMSDIYILILTYLMLFGYTIANHARPYSSKSSILQPSARARLISVIA